jgi:hypothetical protein
VNFTGDSISLMASGACWLPMVGRGTSIGDTAVCRYNGGSGFNGVEAVASEKQSTPKKETPSFSSYTRVFKKHGRHYHLVDQGVFGPGVVWFMAFKRFAPKTAFILVLCGRASVMSVVINYNVFSTEQILATLKPSLEMDVCYDHFFRAWRKLPNPSIHSINY